MNRLEWINEKRILAEKRYDTIFSMDYDKNWGKIEEIHRKNLIYFLNLIPCSSKILDAPCGTGKYWSMITSEGFNVFGIDQSQKMLENATAKYTDVSVEKIGLQEINYISEFYGIICIDAMENVFPEDWTVVLGNFYKALKKDGYLYFSVETIDKAERDEAFKKGIEMELPVVEGEVAHTGGYHYYPDIEKVKAKLKELEFHIVKEDISDGYHHFIVRK
ncbi:class I SAM-dependent methyltransferase [Clostridium sp. UBA6640]|uniref:class I SAM-dependent methyltransferase n=1 Tax=Clostridium sp. UBA6640 TaxID=1946370 RepID=UPI0025B965C9|nr:class I SAM-dependent methyltransferase [Clostridium sp. UBA6640]